MATGPTAALPARPRSIRLARYAANSGMAPHHHELPSLSIVVSGMYEERVRGRVTEHGAADCYSAMVIQGLALEALGLFCRAACSQPKVLPWLREARSFIESHFDEVVTLDELARMVERHPIHLSRAFRQAYGQTVGECTRSARLRHAARLLLATRQPISEVAIESGFCDQAHLTRAFKRIFGMTPAAYRAAGQ